MARRGKFTQHMCLRRDACAVSAAAIRIMPQVLDRSGGSLLDFTATLWGGNTISKRGLAMVL